MESFQFAAEWNYSLATAFAPCARFPLYANAELAKLNWHAGRIVRTMMTNNSAHYFPFVGTTCAFCRQQTQWNINYWKTFKFRVSHAHSNRNLWHRKYISALAQNRSQMVLWKFCHAQSVGVCWVQWNEGKRKKNWWQSISEVLLDLGYARFQTNDCRSISVEWSRVRPCKCIELSSQ